MTADAPATLVWLAPGDVDGVQAGALSAWAAAHRVALAPAEDPPPAALAVDPELAFAVDEHLDHARDALAEHDAAEVDRALDRAQELLRAHPELSNAAWLMAEVERARSTRLRRLPPVDLLEAERAWARADALDGGRVPAAGEQGAAQRAPPAEVTIARGPSTGQAWIDGAPLPEAPIATRAGPHAFAVTSRGLPVWAAWIDIAPGESTLPWPAPPPAPCSRDDVSGVRVEHGALLQLEAVRCPHWVAATSGLLPGAVRIATCEGPHCSPLLDWRQAPPWAPSSTPPWTRSPAAPRERPRPTAWIPWAIAASAGAAAAAAIAIGVAATPRPGAETRFVGGGLKE